MKRKVAALIVGCILILIIPLIFIISGLVIKPQYNKTYYGELSLMYDKLKNTKEKKVVLLGNSAVAFGVDSALLQKELNDCGIDYKVCNFGLYGALGTKLMLDLAEDCINDGDIVVFMPELMQQSMSLYFSAEQTWRALDSKQSLFWSLKSENRQQLVGQYVSYVAEKAKYATSGGAEASGVYGSASFDENCDMKNYPREANTMYDGYDPDNLLDFDINLLSDNFLDYVNQFHATIQSANASMYFYFSPMNEKGMKEGYENNIDAFCEELSEKIDFNILGNPSNSIMQAEWFYDANVHLNESGMTVYTAKLADAIKTRLGNTTPNGITLPDMPDLPEYTIQGQGDNSHKNYFTYSDDGSGGLTVVGLSEEGKTQTALIVPWTVNGKTVTSFSAETFSNNVNIKQITLQKNIQRIRNGSFDGCSSLEKLILKHEKPEQIGISSDMLFADSPKCYVYVKDLDAFSNNYSWSLYIKLLLEDNT